MSLLNIQINKNGSFDIVCDELKLTNCYPGLDGQAIMPVLVSVTAIEKSNQIVYTLENGTITLDIIKEENRFVIASHLQLNDVAPHWFYVFSQAKLVEATGVFRQGLGFAGPSGYQTLQFFQDKKQKLESFGVIALNKDKNNLFLFINEHERFISRFDVQVIDREGVSRFISGGFRIEGVDCSDLEMPLIVLFQGNDLGAGLEKSAREIAKNANARTHREPAYHWCSWYYTFENFTHDMLLEHLQGFQKLNPPVPFRYIQIDAGYGPSLGDWLTPNSRWPQGLKESFNKIKEYGYKPAIWIAPYIVGSRSQVFQEHPEWMLHKQDGAIHVEKTNYNEDKFMSYVDEEYYVLDVTHPEAMAHIKNVFRTMKAWGAEMFKTDFMYWGIQDSMDVRWHTSGKTSVENFVDLLKAIREEIGEESYWLGCIAPFYPFIGYADAMRVAGDVCAGWYDEYNVPANMIQETVADNYFNNIYWQNDPDAIYLRDFHIHLLPHEVESLCLLQALSGGAVYTSDPIHQIAKDRLDLFRFVEPTGKVKPTLPFLSEVREDIVLVHQLDDGKRFILFFFNPTPKSINQFYSIEELTGEKELFLSCWQGASSQTDDFLDSSYKKEILTLKFKAHESKLYFASKEGLSNNIINNIWRWN